MGFRYIPASAGPETYGVLGGLRGISGAAGGGSINFDFTTGSLPGAITFTRASIGTYNSSGNILTTASNDVARFNYVSGVANLLIEGSATNLLLQSNNFSDPYWTVTSSAVITGSQFVSPDGTNNGWSFTTAGAANGGVQVTSFPFSAVPYVLSVWVKQITGTSGTAIAIAGIASATIPTTTTITRYSFTRTAAAGSSFAKFVNAAASSTNGYFGVQMETGSVPTSYIPTTTTSVTRSADSATFVIPTGINQLVYTFDDNSTQTVAVSPGSYTIPTTLNRPNIKSVVGRYAFDFTSGSLPAGMTFTRPSIGTYTNAGGTLITAGNDVARFNYVSGVSCLLVEPSATNLITNSNNFFAAGWATINGTLAANQFVSPDGTSNGWSFTNTTPGGALFYETYTFSGVGAIYTISAWAKQITGPAGIKLFLGGNQSSTLATSATLARMSFVGTVVGVNSSSNFYNADATLGNVEGFYGAQLETGSVMTSYIPTTTAAVTRAADSAVFTIPSGIGHLTYTFDDNSTQLVAVSAGSYTIPTTLNRANIKSIVGSA